MVNPVCTANEIDVIDYWHDVSFVCRPAGDGDFVQRSFGLVVLNRRFLIGVLTLGPAPRGSECFVYDIKSARTPWLLLIRMQSKLHLKTYLLIGVIIIANPIGNVLIAKGMKTVGEVKIWPLADLWPVFLQVFGSLTIWLGIASLITSIIAYMLALSMADYSYVQPAAALGYAGSAVLGAFLLGESISPLRWVGIAVICSGVSFIRNTHPRTTEPSR